MLSEIWEFFDSWSILWVALGILSAVRLFHERRPPATVLAWLFLIILVPPLGLFLYWTFGGRRLLLRRQPKLAELPSEPPRRSDGNALEFLDRPEAAYQAMLELIRDAKTSLHLEIFILSTDAVGTRILKELSQRAKDGLDVRILVDAFGSLKARWSLLDDFKQAGGKVGVFHPLLPWARNWSVNIRNHRKLLVADGTVAITGGMNIGGEYMGPPDGQERWIDLATRVRGPAVASLQHLFAQDWSYATGSSTVIPENRGDSVGDCDLELVTISPTDEDQILKDDLLLGLARAQERVRIVTPYFIPDETLVAVLGGLARRGVQIQLILPATSNHRIADLARARHLRQLIPGGVHVLLHPRMLHAKALAIDEGLVFMGSPNLDLRSLNLNFESGFLMRSPMEVAFIHAWMEGLADQCSPLSARASSRSRAFAESLAFFVSPLL